MNDILNRLANNPARQRQVGGKHYKDLAIQPMEYIHANNIPYVDGNIIKYVTRWRSRSGLQDLEKALHYLEFLIADERARLAEDGPEVTQPELFAPVPGGPEDGGHHARHERDEEP